MSPFLQLAFVLAVILFCAKLASYISGRLGQPSVLGELLVGILLGPSLIDITHLNFITYVHLTEIVNEIGELGVLILMFMAGLELHMSELVRNTRVSAYAGILGVLAPVGLGVVAGVILGLDVPNSVFLGLTLGATSVSISAQTLMELNVIRSRVGVGLLGAAVFDDILVILLLSSFLALQAGDGNGLIEISIVFGKMLLFLVTSVTFGLWVLPRLTKRIASLNVSQGSVTLAIVVLLFYGIGAEIIGGMAAITGTFIAGLMYARTQQKNEIQHGLRSLAYGFFIPIFFVAIGIGIDLKELNIHALWALLLISVIAILGKILGAGLGARLGRFSWRESLQLGIGLVSRGEVGLIVAKIGLDLGYLNNEFFSTIVGMVMITTLVTPPMLRLVFSMPKPQKPAEQMS